MDFLSALGEQSGGKAMIVAGLKLAELIEAVKGTGKKGTLTLSIELRPAEKEFGGNVVGVMSNIDIKIKKPDLPLAETFFFVDDDGNLTRNDPRQEEMFAERKEVR